jgi:glycosyltransferase involved in cell wall biosynthesis
MDKQQSDGHIVSVIISTTQRSSLDQCRAALAKQTRPADEVIIITDSERKGPAWARNQGLKQACGDLIAFTDDDCIPPTDWLAQLIQAIDRHDAAGAGGTVIEIDPLLYDQHGRRNFPKIEMVDTAGWVADTANVMYKRVWLDLRAERDGFVFNETFRIAQDAELAWRLRVYGAKLIFVPNRVIHLRRTTPLKYLPRQFNRGVAIARLFRVQRSVNTPITHQPSLIWGHGNSSKGAKWLKAFWYKIVGPFDKASFRQTRHFCLFWLGEKFQTAGFIWGVIRQSLVERNTAKPDLALARAHESMML